MIPRNRMLRLCALTLCLFSASRSEAQVFASPMILPTGAAPRYIVAPEINNDGVSDIVVLNVGSNSIGVYVSTGAGTFNGPTIYNVGGQPTRAAIGDFNGDSHDDLAVTVTGTSDLWIFLNNGFGSFNPPSAISSGAATAIVATTLDSGSSVDLAYGESSLTVAGRRLLGSGNGSFTSTAVLPGTGGILDLAAADLDGDLDMDLVTLNWNGSQYRLYSLLNNGSASFTANATILSTPGETLALGDFNGTAGVDVAVGNTTTNLVRIFTNNGFGNFVSAGTFPADAPATNVLATEVNGDGIKDLVVCHAVGNNLSLLLGDGTGSFSLTTVNVGAAETRAAASGDFNGDGLIDLVTCRSATNQIAILFNIGTSLTNFRKPMITEVSWGVADFVEITNFDTAPLNLGGWTVVWKDGSIYNSLPLNFTLAPNQSAIVVEGSGGLVAPPGAVLQVAIPTVNTSGGDFAVALKNVVGAVIDEVRIASTTGTYTEGSLGGIFRGIVQRSSPSSAASVERIWGIDTNSAADWTEQPVHSAGYESRSSGPRGTDPLLVRPIFINEFDDAPDYIELRNPIGTPTDLAGWFLLVSPQQRAAPTYVRPFPVSTVIPANGYLVIGNDGAVPLEMPAGTPYVALNAVGSSLLPLGSDEAEIALYDNLGRLVDLLRTTGHDDQVVHNSPRAPSYWIDFTGAALRSNGFGDNALGRINGADTNQGSDWAPVFVRTMGFQNAGFSSCCGLTGGFDFRLSSTPTGGGITLIVNAGPTRAGARYSLFASYSRTFGTGPFLGLGADAINNWILFNAIQPFGANLDSNGSYRYDLAPGTYPPGGAVDLIAILQASGTGALIARTAVVEYDT